MHPTNHIALLFATLIGVAACDNSVPTGATTPVCGTDTEPTAFSFIILTSDRRFLPTWA